jgi:hypothetical protein
MLINEMSLRPFNKVNCLAMLNTLYNPIQTTAPTNSLTTNILRHQRDRFFTLIQAVEKTPDYTEKILRPMIETGKLEGHVTGWPALQEELNKYLIVTKGMIQDCEVVTTQEYPPIEEEPKRKGRKVDSGVSFGSDRRPSTRGSTFSSEDVRNGTESALKTMPSDKKNLSTLEKITREFKKMRLRHKDSRGNLQAEVGVREAMQHPMGPPPILQPDAKQKKTLKKAKSVSALGDLKHKNTSSVSLLSRRKASETEEFDPVFMKKQRMAYEASQKNTR